MIAGNSTDADGLAQHASRQAVRAGRSYDPARGVLIFSVSLYRGD
jgi:hypothetical protein